MVMPKDEVQEEMTSAWRTYLDGLEKSLNIVEENINEAKEMAGVCTNEWCEATEHVIDEIGNSLFPSVNRAGPTRKTASGSKISSAESMTCT